MPETKRYIPTPTEIAIRKWVVASLGAKAFSDVAVIYQGQGFVRSQRPFVTVEVLTDDELQDPEEEVDGENENPDGTYPVDVFEQRQGTVRVICYGSKSWLVARAIHRSLGRADVLDTNRNNGIEVLRAITPISNVPEFMSTHTEPRRQQDFIFAYCDVTRLPDGTGVLERFIATGEVDEVDAEIDVSWPST